MVPSHQKNILDEKLSGMVEEILSPIKKIIKNHTSCPSVRMEMEPPQRQLHLQDLRRAGWLAMR